jgi:hypothetical protein
MSNKLLTKEILGLKNEFSLIKELTQDLINIITSQNKLIQSINDFIYEKKSKNDNILNENLKELENILKNE